MQDAARRSVSRRDLERDPLFAHVSPRVGELDAAAMEEALARDPDAATGLLADMVGATDRRLRELARRVASRVVVDLARTGGSRPGVGRLRRRPLRDDGGDMDLDASLEEVVRARRAGRPPDADDLVAAGWQRPDTALCLLVDRSGSMHGHRLATAAVAAAAVVLRAGADCSVVAFAQDAVVLRSQGSDRPAELVVADLLTLAGHGTTDVALALRAAGAQLARSTATRKVALLLSDCRATSGGDPAVAVGAVDELVILAPGDDVDDAAALAGATGSRWAPLGSVTDVPAAVGAVLDTGAA